MAEKTQGGYWAWDPWSGEQVWIPDNSTTTTTTTKKTALDYINSIFSGANGILSQLFPYGLNNQGQLVNTNLYPTTGTTGGGNNNTFIYLLFGLAIMYLLLKDKK